MPANLTGAEPNDVPRVEIRVRLFGSDGRSIAQKVSSSDDRERIAAATAGDSWFDWIRAGWRRHLTDGPTDTAQLGAAGRAVRKSNGPTMKACLLHSPAAIERNPLEFTRAPDPRPGKGDVLVRVEVCGVCRTDLHVVEGDLPQQKSPVIPGHQVVGVVEELGEGSHRFPVGARVGIAWLNSTDQSCEFCRAGMENLCDRPAFTGYTVDGGYAQYALAPEEFVYPIPESFAARQAAPLLCAGIIGFRALRLSGIKPDGNLGFYGFGAAAHVAIQVARHWGVRVYACTRGPKHQQLAIELGAVWAE